jgi:uncharacterized protein
MKRLRGIALIFMLAVAPASTFAALPDAARFGAVAELGDVRQVRQWLDEGLDPNFVADRIGTGLMIAAWTGNIPLLDLLVSRGADIQRSNGFGETALMHAAWKGNGEAVAWLLAHGAKINRAGNEWSALHYAAFAGHAEVAQQLLARGADINARSSNGSSVLMMAIYEGHDDLARMLIQRGADRSIRNERGDSALDWAVKFKRDDIARLIGSATEVASAASLPKNAEARRSESEPDSIEELLRIRRILQARGLKLEVVDQRTAAMRARLARASIARERQARMPVLEISARRGAPEDQRMQLLPR